MRMGRPLCWPRSQKWPYFSYPHATLSVELVVRLEQTPVKVCCDVGTLQMVGSVYPACAYSPFRLVVEQARAEGLPVRGFGAEIAGIASSEVGRTVVLSATSHERQREGHRDCVGSSSSHVAWCYHGRADIPRIARGRASKHGVSKRPSAPVLSRRSGCEGRRRRAGRQRACGMPGNSQNQRRIPRGSSRLNDAENAYFEHALRTRF